MTIRGLVERERQHVQRSEIARGALLTGGAVAFLVSVGAMVLGRARWLSLPRGVPFAIWMAVVAAGAALAWITSRRLRSRATSRDVAHAIEEEQGMRRGALIGVLEMEGQGALAERAALGIRSRLPKGAPLAPAMRRHVSRRMMVGAGAAAAGVLVLVTTTPLFADGLRAVLRPIDAWSGTLLSRPAVEGAPRELLRGSPLKLSIRADGRRMIYLAVRQTGDAWRTDTLRVGSDGLASWSTDALRGDLRLVATDGRSSSDSVTVRAADRPFVGAVGLHAHYPAYLGRSDESLPVGEPLRLPRGTTLSVTGRASVALADVTLTSPSGVHVALATTGQTFSGSFVPERSEALQWGARGPGGLVPDLPESLSIDVLADSVPHVVIEDPVPDTLLVSRGTVTLGIRVSDDHGVALVALRFLRASAQEAAATTRPVAMRVGTSWAGQAVVDVDSLHLAPGDAYRVRAEATDNSPWAQRGVSREIVIRRATTEEVRTAARAMGDSAVKQALSAAAAEKSLAQKTDEAARAQARQDAATPNTQAGAQQKGAMKFENAEKARALAKEQRAMTDRVQKLRQATKQLEEQLKAAGALDTSLARQLSEAQALMKQALTPEMMAEMSKLESAAQQMNGDQSRDAMRDLSQMQQKMREQLERSAEMLKRAAQEGSMQTLGDEAKELAQKERQLADAKGGKSDRQAAAPEDAKDLAQRSERLRQAMDDLKQRLQKDKADAGASKTDEASKHAAKAEADMREAAKQPSGDEKKGSDEKKGGDDKAGGDQKSGGDQKNAQAGEKKGDQSKGGDGTPQAGQKAQGGQKGAGGDQQQEAAQDAANEMDRAAKSMQDARSEQVKEWKQELTSELDQSVQEMQQLAREERALEQKARDGASKDERRSAQSAVEQGLDKAAERLQGEGKKSALLSSRTQKAMSDAKQKVSQATESVAQPNGGDQKQASSLSDAADALSKAAASLARDRERANSAKSASGFEEMLKEMQQMAQTQGKINGQSQSLLSLPNGANSSQGQSLARTLARQERQLAEQLDDSGDPTGGDRAAQLAQEARQLAEALDNGRVDASTLSRQQQLFRRLLDAGKSLEKEERDDNGKREAKSATGSESFSPNAKADGRAAVKFRPPTWEELRAMSADERRAILDYFTRLNSGTTP